MSAAVRKALALLPAAGTVAVAGPARARWARALARTGRRTVAVVEPTRPWPAVDPSLRVDAALLVDTLAWLPADAQEAAVAHALRAVVPGGPVVLVEVDGARRARAALARWRARRSGQRPGAGRLRTTPAYAVLLREAGATDARVVVPARRGWGWGRGVVCGVAPAPAGATLAAAPDRTPAPGLPSRHRGSRCAACRSLRRRLRWIVDGRRLVRCRDCGLVSNDPLPTEAEALALYDAAYFRGETGYRDYVAEEPAFRAVFRRRLARLLAAGARAGQRLLDVGAASGAFLREARAAGFVVAGVEAADAAAAHARRAGLAVRTATLASMCDEDGVHDVVTGFDVVEHLVDPVEGLRTLARHARPGGLVAVTVPDFGGRWARASGRRWPLLSPHEHLHHFTRRSLVACLRRAGLRVTSVETVGTPVSLGTALREVLGPTGARAAARLGWLLDRGLPLPFGTLLAIARTPKTGSPP